MYAFDHGPPHFHVILNNGMEALVRIEDLRVLESEAKPSALREALAWAAGNKPLLRKLWRELHPE